MQRFNRRFRYKLLTPLTKHRPIQPRVRFVAFDASGKYLSVGGTGLIDRYKCEWSGNPQFRRSFRVTRRRNRQVRLEQPASTPRHLLANER
jgi:hypothetical protein